MRDTSGHYTTIALGPVNGDGQVFQGRFILNDRRRG